MILAGACNIVTIGNGLPFGVLLKLASSLSFLFCRYYDHYYPRMADEDGQFSVVIMIIVVFLSSDVMRDRRRSILVVDMIRIRL